MAKRILVVEDEKDLMETLALRLKSNDYEVIRAHDGQEGLDKARRENPNLIILDLMLPKMDGYKVCGLLKRDTRYSRIPIIIFTARGQDSDKKMGEDLGADAYITKPFDTKTLLDKIEELIEK